MMRYITIKNSLLVAVAVLFAACSDDFFKDINGSGELNGISLGISVVEQADLIYEYGQTRGGTTAMDSDFVRANALTVYPLKGGESENLYVHRMPLPFVGIHPRTAHGSNDTKAATRAPISEIAGNGIAFHDSLTIWGYTSGRTGGDVTLFDQILVQKINGFRTACEWPYATAGTMKFYAIAPAIESIEENINITNKASIAYGTGPAFTYTVPDAPAAQRDLVYGKSSEIAIATSGMDKEHIGEDNRIVGMTFTHILTAIRFAQGNLPVGFVIKELKLTGVQNTGSYDGSAWSSQDGSKDYTINTSWTSSYYAASEYEGQTVKGHTYAAEENVYIDNNQVLFLMPQTVPSGAKLTVKLNTGVGEDRTLTCNINGDTWDSGHTVTYKITIGEVAGDYYLLVGTPGSSETQNDHEAKSATSDFTVHSYHMYKNYESSESGADAPKAIRWKVSKYSDDGSIYTADKPATLSWLTLSGSSEYRTGGSNQPLAFSVGAQSAAYTIDHRNILYDNNIGGYTIDLSCYRPNGNGIDKLYSSAAADGSTKKPYQTANCYIVNCAGTYTFPLVYGNAYEGSITAKTGSALNPGNIFKDHANRTIGNAHIIDQVNYTASTDEVEGADAGDLAEAATANKALVTTEYLYNNVVEDYKAEIVWQDVKEFSISGSGIVQTPTKGGDPGYISFNVGTDPADGAATKRTSPGNCVIAFMAKKTTKKTRKLYDSSDNYLTTRVTTETSGDFEILWTWHIWCTDEVLPNNSTKEVSPNSNIKEVAKHVDVLYPSYDSDRSSKIPQLENFSGTKTSILPVNLGWVPNPDASGDYKTNIYRERKAWVELVQETSGQTAKVIVRQHYCPEPRLGTSTIYQWGRPTALPMLRMYDYDSKSQVAREVYDAASPTPNTISADFTVKDITTVGEMAKYPKNMVHCTKKTRWWEDDVDYAFWGATKTIYDPCPSGYQLPAVGIFSGFSMIDGNSSAASDLNMWTSTESGLRFYAPNVGGYMYASKHTSITAADRYGIMIFIPTHGLWSGDNNDGTSMYETTPKDMRSDPSRGYYWTYALSSYVGTILDIQPDRSSGYVDFNTTKYAVDALPIRPQKTP